MQIIDLRKFITSTVLTSFALIVLSSIGIASDDENKQAPELPPGCGAIQVQAGNKVSFHTYALGYRYIGGTGQVGTSWRHRQSFSLIAAFAGRSVTTTPVLPGKATALAK
jgi:hypothetical protein